MSQGDRQGDEEGEARRAHGRTIEHISRGTATARATARAPDQGWSTHEPTISPAHLARMAAR